MGRYKRLVGREYWEYVETGEEFSVTYIQDRKNIFVWICVFICVRVFVCECEREWGGRICPYRWGVSQDSIKEKALLSSCWCEGHDECFSTALTLCIFPPVHKAHPSTTETLRKALLKTLNDEYVSKVCVHGLLQALQHQHCISTECPQGGGVSLGT